ncbi:cobalamin biosynthesis protein cobt [Gigaspora margarita]|uniref:Cobalamin biosynthesis protein cobt n=1 Tax=Gigaspora margarita TaxID=4874 RepID=A0A8H3WTZ6_GIGMA|nr:cobalamin biosynthesis protein cobt [Gigaspora margarita]
MASFFDSDSDDSVEIVDNVDLDENDRQEDINSDSFIEHIAYFTKNLTAQHVQFSAVLVEYPPTDPDGHAIIYNFIESNNYDKANNDQTQKAMKDKIQYSQGGKGGVSYINCPFFECSDDNQIQIMKDQRTCGGVKICPYAHNYLHDYVHTSVDFDSDIFQSIKSNEELRTLSVSSSLAEFNNTNINNGYFIGCTQWKYGVSGHRYLPIEESIDRHLLKKLISGMPLNQCDINDACNTVLSNNSKRLKCSFPHINDKGKPIEANLIHLSCNLIHAYFGVDTLSQIHTSLNNLDRLRYLVGQIQQSQNPYGQGVLDFFNDGHILILCMTKDQAIKLQEATYFQMDLTFKYVQGEINMFELNEYDDNHQLNIAQAKGLGLALSEIDSSKDWTEHLIYIFKTCRLLYRRNVTNQKYSNKTKNLMQNILTAESQYEIQNLLNQITLSSEDGVKDWVEFYNRPWILASLNHCYSQIDITTLNIIGETTNAAESAHADINREGKGLNLMNAIKRAQKFDNRKFITCAIQDRYGVTKTGRNNGPIAKAAQSIKRHDSLTQLERQISLEERQLELEERKERLREQKLLNYERARELGVEKELGYQ